MCLYRGFSQLWVHWITQLVRVARLSSTPCLAQIFSCRARGTPSTYFFVMTSATVEGDARECFMRGGGVLVVTI